MSSVCLFALAGVFVVNAEDAPVESEYSVVGVWAGEVKPPGSDVAVAYEFKVDETHVEFMGEKTAYKVVYEGKWALMTIELKAKTETEPATELCFLIQFDKVDKVKMLTVGPAPNEDMFLNKK
jgi:hypothetical protein